MTPKDRPANPLPGVSRRTFLYTSALAAGGLAIGGCATTAPRPRPRLVSANDKLNIAIVGYGGKGDSDAKYCESENIVALCDADEKVAPNVRARYPKAAYYQDFRTMLEKEPSIDALNIATPDHLHAYIASTAIRLGKHVYVQKPLTHSVYEARLLRRLAREYGVATQMGNQGSAANGLRRAVEVIQAGVIGNVSQVYVWSNRPFWPQAIERPSGADPIPDGLNWDLWLGPAETRPYKGVNPNSHRPREYPNYYHTFNWRGWTDFGTGSLGDMACHTCNLPFRALKLGYPTQIESETEGLTRDCYPIKSKIRFEFPAREGLVPLTFRWYDGGNRANSNRSPYWYHDGDNKPPKEVMANIVSYMDQTPTSGCLMIGDKGEIFSDNDYGTTFHLKLRDEKTYTPGANHPAVTLAAIPESIPRNQFMQAGARDGDLAHHQEWIAACKGGPPGYSNFEISAYITEIILLGCVAMRSGKKLEWDGPKMLARNAPEASQYVHPAFRDGWKM